MPQREPARRQAAGEPPGSTVKMRLDEKGRWVPVLPEAETPPAEDAADEPPAPGDRRDAAGEPDAG